MTAIPRAGLLRSLTRRSMEFKLMTQDSMLLAGLLVVGAFIFMFVAWPLARVIAQGFFTPDGQFSLEQFRRYVDPNSTRHYRLIFYNTMQMGTLSALFGTT